MWVTSRSGVPPGFPYVPGHGAGGGGWGRRTAAGTGRRVPAAGGGPGGVLPKEMVARVRSGVFVCIVRSVLSGDVRVRTHVVFCGFCFVFVLRHSVVCGVLCCPHPGSNQN